MSKRAIVGGMFGVEQTQGRRLRFADLAPTHIKRYDYAAARCGLRVAAEAPGVDRIWLPSYLCASMIEALAGIDRNVRFYPVDAELRMEDRDWISTLNERDLVVLIAYFGNRPAASLTADLALTGALILADAAACPPMSGADWGADAILYSPRKLAGVPDGGVLLDLTGRIGPLAPPTESAAEWVALAEKAFAARTEFDRAGARGRDRIWYQLQQEWERNSCSGIWSMGDLTRSILDGGLPWLDIAARRRGNHSALAAKLAPAGLHSFADGSACPLGYVLNLGTEAARNAVRDALIAQSIYPPIHWQAPEALPRTFAASHDLAARILTLPCDQRYSTLEMDRTATIVLAALGDHGDIDQL